MKTSALRYLRIYAALLKNSLTREMGFRANFYIWLGVELLWFGLQLTFNEVVFQNTESIGTWTKWQVILLIGTSHFIQQIFQTFFLVNCIQISEHVRSGRFDLFLLSPVSTRFLISARHVDLGGLFSAGTGLVVVVYACQHLGIAPAPLQIIGYLSLCAIGVALHYSIMFLMASTCFWWTRSEALMMAYYDLFSITRLPESAFSGAIRSTFALAIPLLMIAAVPAKTLFGVIESPSQIVALISSAVLWFGISQFVWERGLRAYRSASS